MVTGAKRKKGFTTERYRGHRAAISGLTGARWTGALKRSGDLGNSAYSRRMSSTVRLNSGNTADRIGVK